MLDNLFERGFLCINPGRKERSREGMKHFLNKLQNMECINRIEVRGVVGTVRSFAGDDGTPKSFAFTVVTNYAYRSKINGDTIETTWMNVTAWPMKNISEQDLLKLEKGAKVHLTGRLREDNYTDKDGVMHYAYTILANSLELISGDEQITMEMNM